MKKPLLSSISWPIRLLIWALMAGIFPALLFALVAATSGLPMASLGLLAGWPSLLFSVAWAGLRPLARVPPGSIEDCGKTLGHHWIVVKSRTYWVPKTVRQNRSKDIKIWPISAVIDGFTLNLASPSSGRLAAGRAGLRAFCFLMLTTPPLLFGAALVFTGVRIGIQAPPVESLRLEVGIAVAFFSVAFGLAFAAVLSALSVLTFLVERFFLDTKGSGTIVVKGRVLSTNKGKITLGPDTVLSRDGHRLRVVTSQQTLVLIGTVAAVERLHNLVHAIIVEQEEAEVPEALYRLTQKQEAQ